MKQNNDMTTHAPALQRRAKDTPSPDFCRSWSKELVSCSRDGTAAAGGNVKPQSRKHPRDVGRAPALSPACR